MNRAYIPETYVVFPIQFFTIVPVKAYNGFQLQTFFQFMWIIFLTHSRAYDELHHKSTELARALAEAEANKEQPTMVTVDGKSAPLLKQNPNQLS